METISVPPPIPIPALNRATKKPSNANLISIWSLIDSTIAFLLSPALSKPCKVVFTGQNSTIMSELVPSIRKRVIPSKSSLEWLSYSQFLLALKMPRWRQCPSSARKANRFRWVNVSAGIGIAGKAIVDGLSISLQDCSRYSRQPSFCEPPDSNASITVNAYPDPTSLFNHQPAISARAVLYNLNRSIGKMHV